MRFSLQREAFLKPLAQVVNVVERRQTLPVLANLLASRAGGTAVADRHRPRSRDGRALRCRRCRRWRHHHPGAQAVRHRPRPARRQQGHRLPVRRQDHGAGRTQPLHPGQPAGERLPLDRRGRGDRAGQRARGGAEGADRAHRVRDGAAGRALLPQRPAVRPGATSACVASRPTATAWRCAKPCWTRPCRPSARSSCRARACRSCSACSRAATACSKLEIGRNHIRVKRDDVTFTTKLIDGRFPDYEAVIPIGADREVRIDRESLRAALQRAAILSNEKYRGVRLEVSPGQLKINAHNPEQEEAQEEVEADTKVDAPGGRLQRQLPARCPLRPARRTPSSWHCATPTPRRWSARPATSVPGTW